MRRFSIYTIFLFLFGILPKLVSQDHFIKIIDIDSFPQVCQQIVKFDDNYLLGYYQTCTDLQSQCSGIIKVNEELKIIDQVILDKFSNNPNSILINKDTIYLTGERYYVNNVDGLSFNMHSISSNLDNINKLEIRDTINKFINMFQLVNCVWNNKIVIGGSGSDGINTGSEGLLFIISEKSVIDTIINLDFLRGNIIPWEMYVDAQNRLTVHLQTNSFDTSGYFTQIMKFDTSYNLVYKWVSDKFYSNDALPFGFQHANGSSIINIIEDSWSAINYVSAINPDSTIVWRQKWPGSYASQARFINRLRKAKNGDVLGVGRFGNLIHQPRLSRVPFLFRINEHGQLLWLRVYYKNQTDANDNIVSGGFNDIVETDDGDLIAVGQIQNYLEYDPKVQGPRKDWDILIARLGADGCLEPGCGEINVIDIDTDVNEAVESDIKCYPNPVKGESFNLEIPHDHLGSNFNVLVMDVMGKSVLHSKVDKGMNEIRIEHAGLYLVKVLEKGNVVYTSKVVKI